VTILRRDDGDTPFGDWIRRHPGLDSIRERLCVTDSDYWIHRYRAHADRIGWRAVDLIMLVEVKTWARGVPFAQRDTLSLVHELLRRAGKRPDSRRGFVKVEGVPRPGEVRHVRCYGVHVLQLSGARPDNSESILWDGKVLNEDLLVQVLRFDRDPDSPMKGERLRRHHKQPPRAANLLLFGSVDEPAA
jgi:hypothetical protein